jgi:hypothetical protein
MALYCVCFSQIVGSNVQKLAEFQALPPGAEVIVCTQPAQPHAARLHPIISIAEITEFDLISHEYQRLMQQQSQAAAVLQRVFRMHLSRRLRRAGLRQHRSATTITRVFRGFCDRQVCFLPASVANDHVDFT